MGMKRTIHPWCASDAFVGRENVSAATSASSLTALLNTHMLFLHISLDGLFLEIWWDGLHDLVGLDFVINLEGQELSWSSELELGGVGSLVLLDGDSVGLWKMLVISSHDLDEFLQVLDFLWHLMI